MALVVDVFDMTERRKTLPTEAFFVDTNAVIDFADPFGMTISGSAEVQARTQAVIQRLKSAGYKSRASVVVALEYYKHLQYGFLKTHASGFPFTTTEFKKRRRDDERFAEGWLLLMKNFEKTFRKNFPICYRSNSEDLHRTFDGMATDFGDHAIYDLAVIESPAFPCIFTRDRDFLNFPDPLFLLTADKGFISEARLLGKLHTLT